MDAQDVHATGDIPLLGALFGSPIAAGLSYDPAADLPETADLRPKSMEDIAMPEGAI